MLQIPKKIGNLDDNNPSKSKDMSSGIKDNDSGNNDSLGKDDTELNFRSNITFTHQNKEISLFGNSS